MNAAERLIVSGIKEERKLQHAHLFEQAGDLNYIVFFLRAILRYIGLITLYIKLLVENIFIKIDLPLLKMLSNHKMYLE